MIVPASVRRRRRILGAAGRLLSRPLTAFHWATGHAIVLVYHRISPHEDPFDPPTHPNLFEAQMEFVQTHFEVVALDEIVARLHDRRSLRRCCAITFDDGFADFAEFAYPVLSARQIPVTHFLTVLGLVEGRPTWNYRLNRTMHYLDISPHLHYRPRSGAPPTLAEINAVTRAVAALGVDAREQLLCALEETIPALDQPAFLRPQDITRFDRNLVEWGSHTVTHQSLATCEPNRVDYELRHSKTTLQEVIGRDIRFFAYPNGEFNQQTISAAEQSGYRASFTATSRTVRSNSRLHAIPRFDIGRIPMDMLMLELAELTPRLRTFLRGRG